MSAASQPGGIPNDGMRAPRPADLTTSATESVIIDLSTTPRQDLERTTRMEEFDNATHAAPPSEDRSAATAPPTLAEELLLLLLQPDNGSIAGEGTLYYVLAGAVLTELGFSGHIRSSDVQDVHRVEAVSSNSPTEHLLRAGWEYLSDRPRDVQDFLAAIGPSLRQPLLDRLADRGDIRRVTKKVLGLFETTALEIVDNSRRDRLLAGVRAVLVDGTPQTPRITALAALLYGSGTLPQFDRDIPWTSAVISRAEELKAGDWGAGAAADAVARTFTATIVNSIIIAAASLPRSH